MLRFCLLLLPAVLQLATAAAQYGTGTQRLMGNKRGEVVLRCPRFYAGLSTGLNNPVGIAGAQIEVPVTQRISIVPGFGFGTWGWKASLEGRYFFSPCNRGFALSAGGAYAAGGTEIFFESASAPSGKASFIQRPVFNALLSACYFAGIGRQGHRLHFQAGFAVPVQDDPGQQRGGTPGSVPKSRYFEVQPPGGPIVAAGISFGIGRFRGE